MSIELIPGRLRLVMGHPSFVYTTNKEEWEQGFLQLLLVHGAPPWDGFSRLGNSWYTKPSGRYHTEAGMYLNGILRDIKLAIAEHDGAGVWSPVSVERRARNMKNCFFIWCHESMTT